MPQISIVKLKDVKEAKRFDAEYFKPEFLEVENEIDYFDNYTLDQISLIITNGHTPRHADLTVGEINFITAEHITDFVIQENNLKHIKKEPHFGELKRTILEINDILGTIKGKIGNFAVVSFNPKEKYNINQDVSRIKLKDGFNPYYVSAFLNSKFGKKQSIRVSTGQINPFLSLGSLKTLKIPLLPQSFQIKIEKIVKQAYQNQSRAKELYKEAERLLLEELDLVNYKPKHKFTFTATKKEVDEAGRFDAEYFQPKYAEIIEKIENYHGGWEYVGDVVDWKKGIEVGSDAYTEQGKDFVRVSDFTEFGIENVSKKIDEKLFDELKTEHQPKVGEILFTKDGTIGISYVLKEELDGILSGAFLRLSKKEKFQNFESEVISLIFNSIITKMQVEKLSGGVLISHLKPSDFEKFKIPLISPQIQTQIAQKIQESHKLRKQAKELLEKAKKKVEEEIEKG